MPTPLLSVMRSLSFDGLRNAHLSPLSDDTWRNLLRLTDRSQLTLPLGVHCLAELPQWVGARIQRDLANNSIRHDRTIHAYREVERVFDARGIKYLVLKGFSQWPLYCDDLRARPQYDLDLYCPKSDIKAAYDAVVALGYEPFRQKTGTPVDHLSPLIRKTGWRPRDDYYDPDMPLTIELHFRFWDPATECFDVEGAETFWDRRCVREIAGMSVPTLNPVDALSYTAWHLTRHLLRGDVRAYHVYELAHFLHQTVADDEFWQKWREARPSPIVECIAFRLAAEWFQCDANQIACRLMNSLPAAVETWFSIFGLSPLTTMERPNKDELFLHLALVSNSRDRLRIVRRRLFPFRFNPVVVDAHVPAPGAGLRWKRRIFGAWFMGKRMLHHARTFLPVLKSGLRWRLALASHRTPHVESVLP